MCPVLKLQQKIVCPVLKLNLSVSKRLCGQGLSSISVTANDCVARASATVNQAWGQSSAVSPGRRPIGIHMQSAYFNQSKRFFPQVFPEGYFQILAGQKPNRYLEIGKSMVHHTRETNRMHQIAFFLLSLVCFIGFFVSD